MILSLIRKINIFLSAINGLFGGFLAIEINNYRQKKNTKDAVRFPVLWVALFIGVGLITAVAINLDEVPNVHGRPFNEGVKTLIDKGFIPTSPDGVSELVFDGIIEETDPVRFSTVFKHAEIQVYAKRPAAAAAPDAMLEIPDFVMSGPADFETEYVENVLTIGGFYSFGSYPQTSSGHYLPIQWRILDVDTDKQFLLLLSEKILDHRITDKNSYPSHANDWSKSNIKSWLNDEFLYIAFNAAERDSIVYNTQEYAAGKRYNAYVSLPLIDGKINDVPYGVQPMIWIKY